MFDMALLRERGMLIFQGVPIRLFIHSLTRLDLLVILGIDVCFLPLACWYLTLEHNINLTVGETLHLR
jgi:hypothetical protein